LAARTGKGFGAAGKTGSFFLRRKEKAFFFRGGNREVFRPAEQGVFCLDADAPQAPEPELDACRGTAACSGTVRLAPPHFAARLPSVLQSVSGRASRQAL